MNSVLHVTFEFGLTVFGGIGACLNGLYPVVSKAVDTHVCRLVWSSVENRFGCEFFSGGTTIPKQSEGHFIDAIERYIALNRISHLHVHHGSKEIAELLLYLCDRPKRPTYIYTCHSIFSFEQNVRDIPAEWISYESVMIGLVDVIHLLNESSRSWFQLCYPSQVASKSVRIIPNGYDERLKSLRWRPPDSPVITCLSRWAPGKGIEHFLQARHFLLKADPSFKFYVGGRDPNAYGDHVQRYVEKINKILAEAPENTELLPWAPLEEAWSVLASSSVVVVPSEIEYCPFSFIEPAIIGVPIVASDLPTVNELVGGRTLHAKYSVGDVDGLAKELLEVVFRPEVASSNARSLRQVMLKQYSWQSLVPQYLSLYSV